MGKRIPKLDAINAMDRGMSQRGYTARSLDRQPKTDDGAVTRLYDLCPDLDGVPHVSVSISHNEVMLPFDEFTAMMTARIDRAIRNRID